MLEAETGSVAKSAGNRVVRITIRGRLSDRVAASFDGLVAVRQDACTTLVGELVDQAQLFGLVARVRDLGLSLESVYLVPALELDPQSTDFERRHL